MKKITDMTGPEMLAEYNTLAVQLDQPTIKKFRDKPTAARRLASIRKQAENLAKRKKEKTPAPGRPAKKRKGRNMRLAFAPQPEIKQPRDGTLASAVLNACLDNQQSIEDLEKVVDAFHNKKGNKDKLKCSVRYFTCRAISNLAKLNGYGFRQEIKGDKVYVTAYTSAK